jgi:KDO2-lipid IV(A) lauroyltransferase
LQLGAWLPLSFLQSLAKCLGACLYYLPTKTKVVTEKNLSTCFPKRSDTELEKLTRASLTNTACTMLEMGKSWVPPMEESLKLVVDSEGEEQFFSAARSSSGVILLAPHIGNWEIFGFHLCDKLKSTWLYQPPKFKLLDELITKTRSRAGIEMTPTNRAGVSNVLGALKRGEVVGILPDQIPSAEGGEFAPFFGEPAFTMTLVSRLIQKTQAKVFCGFAKRLSGAKGYKVIVEEAKSDIYSKDINKSLIALNKTIEKTILISVEQYSWEYKRFRKRPDGSRFYD